MQYLASRGYRFVTAVHVNEIARTALLEVPHERLRSRAEQGFTSRRQLHFVANAISSKFDLRVLVVFQDTKQTEDIVAGLRAYMLRAYPSVVLGAFVSFLTSQTATVWVEVKELPDVALRRAMQEVAEKYLAAFGIDLETIDFLAPSLPEASLPAILRSVKRLAPVDVVAIRVDLGNRGFSCPSDKWLSSRLDAARKRGLLQRDPRGRYILTAAGLGAVPNTRTRSSSDIDRILWLARRKEW